jgi:phenylpropionate dioxygenase-like ring-hydroxylating dioxygenase large terminal subunit
MASILAAEPTPGQRKLAERLVAGDQKHGRRIAYLPASLYLNEARFDREVEMLFKRHSQLVAPSALLPRPAMAVPHDGTGLPLLLSRDRDGKAHVLLNICRHRGSRLVEGSDPVCATRLVCPYHAWSYGPDGRLAGVSRPDHFPGLDKARFALAELPSRESAGLIWFARREEDFAADEEVIRDLDTFGLASHHLFARRLHEVDANWKLIMDAFLEGYHVQRLHASSIGPLFGDGVVSGGDIVGIHQRSAVGRIDRLASLDTGDWPAVRDAVTFAYQLFPATIVIVSADYVNIMVLMPQAVDRTQIEDFMLVPHPPRDDAEAARWQASWKILDEGAFEEDFRAAALSQKGLASGFLPVLTLGTNEAGIRRFHAKLDDALGAA